MRRKNWQSRVKGRGTATPDEIARLISFIKENGGIEYAVQTMNVYSKRLLIYWLLCRNLIFV